MMGIINKLTLAATPTTTGYLAIGDFDTAPGGAGAGGWDFLAHLAVAPTDCMCKTVL
ncbi:MAG: hypothetical protein R2822_06720 [Spirosomataceae bacterium]